MGRRRTIANMRLPRLLGACAVSAGLLVAAAPPALAAPQVLSSDPESGQEFHADAPERVSITFSEPIDSSSRIRVRDDCGNRVDDGKVTISGVLSNEISVGITKTVRSTYTVRYAVTGITGEASASYGFVVHGGKACERVPKDRAPVERETRVGRGNDGGREAPPPGSTSDTLNPSTAPQVAPVPGNASTTQEGNTPRREPETAALPPQGQPPPLVDEPALATPSDLTSPSTASGAAAAIALGLAVVIGAAGGWLFRVAGDLSQREQSRASRQAVQTPAAS